MWNCTSKWIWLEKISKIRFECVIECQIYYVNECGTECEILHQSKIRFEYVIECQIYYVNKCGIDCEIVRQSKTRFIYRASQKMNLLYLFNISGTKKQISKLFFCQAQFKFSTSSCPIWTET